MAKIWMMMRLIRCMKLIELKKMMMISFGISGIRWLSEIMQGHENRCVNMFRMNKDTLLGLCNELESKYGLKSSRRMSVIEKACMFLWTVAIGAIK
ncbi:conserved hypothetical protein [Ricinus communis]|uniref:DUF8040 domain-containing protein n=1 Tax=Ricinus communis TaxID=3988 RepID=B9SUA3_RICCO|nr:conserved hypothetical protein [Ricinus communis]